MPATEADVAYDERTSYEFAFHILPTVAEGEVPTVFSDIKERIASKGEIISEENPDRVELAYPIVKQIEGKNRKFTSAYFGWVRFKLDGAQINELTEELAEINAILRHLLIKLTPLEEAHTFRFHENRKSVKMVEVAGGEGDVIGEVHTEVEESVEVSKEALDESLEKITKDEEVKV